MSCCYILCWSNFEASWFSDVRAHEVYKNLTSSNVFPDWSDILEDHPWNLFKKIWVFGVVFILMKLELVDFVLVQFFIHFSFSYSFRRWCIPIFSSNSMEVFNQFHPIPYTKMLTFYRSEPFQLEAAYNSTDPTLLNLEIGFIFLFFVWRCNLVQL